MGRRTGLAVFPPYVAEVSESPQLALKVGLGKLIKGGQGIVKPCVMIIRAAEPFEPPILGSICHGAHDDKAQSGKIWVPSSCGGPMCASTIWSLLDCWTLGSAAREPRRSKTPPESVRTTGNLNTLSCGTDFFQDGSGTELIVYMRLLSWAGW